MNTGETQKNKKRIAAFDIMIAVLLLLCIAGIVLRMVMGETSLFSKDAKGDYVVSYVIHQVQDEYSDFFSKGCEFYLENGDALGTLTDKPAFTPAEIHSENSRGEYVLAYATDGQSDLKGTMLVKGTMTQSGFMLNSDTYIAPNMTLTVSSPDITVEMIITDIAPAQ